MMDPVFIVLIAICFMWVFRDVIKALQSISSVLQDIRSELTIIANQLEPDEINMVQEPSVPGEINIRAIGPCDCPPGGCMEMVTDDSQCINRLSGEVVTKWCASHQSYTWHHDGKCLACLYGSPTDG